MLASVQASNKQRFKYFLGYMSVAMFIALLVMGILYAHTANMVREQLAKTAQNTVHTQQQMLDRVFLEMEQIALQIDADASLSNYRITGAGYDTYQGMLQLQRYLAANDFLVDVAFLFPDDRLLSAVGTFSLSDFNKRYALTGLEDAYQLFTQNDTSLSPKLYSVSSSNRMLATFPLPLVGSPKTRILLFVVDKYQLDALFAPVMQGDMSNFFVLGSWNEVLYQYRSNVQTVDFSSVALSKASSSRMPVSYVYLYDETLEGQSFASLNGRFVQIILLTLIAVFILSEIMSRLNYRPVLRLMELVPKENGKTPDALKDVENYMRQVMDNNLHLAQQLQSYGRLTHDYALEQTFLGRLTQEQATHMLSVTGIHFTAPYYTVFRFLLSSYRPLENGFVPHCPRAELLEKMCAAAAAFGHAEGIEWYDASLVLIVNHACVSPNTQIIFNTLQNSLAPLATLTGGCGSTFEMLSQSQYSLYEAISACELAHFRLIPFMDARDYEKSIPQTQALRLPYQEQLLNAMLHNNRDEIADLLKKCEQTWLLTHADLNALHIQTIGLINRLITTLGDIRPEHFQDSVQELMGNNTLSSFRKALEVLCCSVADALCADEAARKDPLLQRILTCIEENFADPLLSVQSIADKLSMSASYLTRYMREHMNATPSKYAEKIRLQKARELLEKTTLQVKDITCSIGYTDSSSFVRKFKTETGYTPAQYREAMQKQTP